MRETLSDQPRSGVRRRLLTVAATVAVALVASATAALAAPGFDVVDPGQPPLLASNASAIEVINHYRAMADVPDLVEDGTLSTNADLHATYMAQTGSFTHDEDIDSGWYTPEGDAAGRRSAITRGQCTDREAIEAMLRQPFNSARILDPALVSTGFGRHLGAFGCAAALDVASDRTGSASATVKTWPADGTTVGLTSFLDQPSIDQLPDPRTSCPDTPATHTGLPLIAYVPNDENTGGPSAVLKRDGVAVDVCAFDRYTYENPDTQNIPADTIFHNAGTGIPAGTLEDLGRAILQGPAGDERNAVVLFPLDPLSPGSTYEATVTRGTGTPYTWTFRAAPPNRILDTRTGNGGPAVKVGPGETRFLKVAGRGGVPGPGGPAVSAVSLNVTVTGPTATSLLTIYPRGNSRPLASNINFVANQTVANAVMVKLNNSGGLGATDGNIAIYNAAGSTHVIVDVSGWFADEAPAGGQFVPINPTSTVKPRVLDTRTGNGAPAGAVGAGGVVNLLVAGRAGLPAASDISAVVLNITATGGTASSLLKAYTQGESAPVLSSTLNFPAGRTVANLAVVRTSASGRVSIRNQVGSVHVIADVAGYFRSGAVGDGGFVPINTAVATGNPGARILDTRTLGLGSYSINPAPASGNKVGPDSTLELKVTGFGGIPVTADSVVLNVTITQPTTTSLLTAFPTGTPRPPTASNMNYVAGQTIANTVIVKVGTGGKVSLYNALGSTHMIVDVQGYFSS